MLESDFLYMHLLSIVKNYSECYIICFTVELRDTGAQSETMQSEIYVSRSLFNFLTFAIKCHTNARHLYCKGDTDSA
jgi:hypothetical protein